MVGIIDVKVQSHNPNFPLEPVFTFINSAQSFRIRNVPRAVGKWNITNVFVRLAYPDNTTVQKECVLNGNIWIGTVEGCAESGTSTNGFIVTASGIDEDGNTITNYVLGAGDLYVKDLDGTIDPERVGTKMYFNDTLPENPKKGDATFIDQTLNVYDGANWVPAATDYYTKAEVDEAFRDKTDLNVYEEVICPWIITNGVGTQSTYNWNDETQLWEAGVSRIGFVDGVWKYGVKVGTIIRWMSTDDSPQDTLTIAFGTQTGTREAVTKKEVVGTLATESDIPTFTSQLTNNSGFITAAQVPTPDKIEDLSANVIYANRTVQYNEEVANWTDTYYPESPLNWDAENNWWMANISPSLYMKLQFNSGTWTLEIGENVGGEWVIDSDSVQDAQEATVLGLFNISGSAHRLEKGVQQIQATGELALKSDLPTKTSDLTNDSEFITSEEVRPYHDALSPTVNTGVANRAYALSLQDSTYNIILDGVLQGRMRTNVDLTNEFRVRMSYATYYPYVLSYYDGQTYTPELNLQFCNGKIAYLRNGRPRTVYTGYMFRTGGAGFAIPCSENGTPDGRLYVTTSVQPAYIVIENETTSLHQIGFTPSQYGNDDYRTIDKLDGVQDNIHATRTNPYKQYEIYEELANKSDIPTKTSDLTNDSNFITATALTPYREKSDLYYEHSFSKTNWQNVPRFIMNYNGTQTVFDKFDSTLNRWNVSTGTSDWYVQESPVGMEGDAQFTLMNLEEGITEILPTEGAGTTTVTFIVTGIEGTFTMDMSDQLVCKVYVDRQLTALEARIAALEGN